MSSDSLFADGVVVSGKQSTSAGIRRVREESVHPDDLELVRRGDDAALGRVVREYSSLVYGVALRITASEADATDVLQDVFVHLPESLRSFDGGNFAGWLKVVASRQALMLLRSERRHDRYYTATGRVGSWEEQSLSRITLERALKALDPVLRAVFVMKEIEGFTHREIADAMDISENLSQVRLHRARRALRELLLSP